MSGTWALFGYNSSFLIIIVVSALIALTALLGERKFPTHHNGHVDTMAGDEGED